VRGRYSPLVLKRGLVTSSRVIQWCRDAIENLDIEPVTIQVSLLNEQHEPLQTFTFFNAWPKKWSVSAFNAEENRIVIETLDIVYQYFKKS
jgi:phage tail-like protein